MIIDGTDYETDAQATAAILLAEGTRWWGSRLKYRVRGTRHWTTFVLMDVHPFDYHVCATAIKEHIAAKGRP